MKRTLLWILGGLAGCVAVLVIWPVIQERRHLAQLASGAPDQQCASALSLVRMESRKGLLAIIQALKQQMRPSEEEDETDSFSFEEPVDHFDGCFAQAVVEYGSGAAREVVRSLCDEDFYYNEIAVRILGEFGESGATALAEAARSEDPFVRKMVADSLAYSGELDVSFQPELCDCLGALMRDQDVDVAVMAIESLTDVEACHDQLEQELISGLGGEVPRVKARCAATLGRIGRSAGVVSELKDLLESDPDENVRGSAALALGFAGDAAGPAVPLLIESLKREEDQFWAAWALGTIGAPVVGGEAVRALRVLGRSTTDDEIKEVVADALKSLAGEE